MVFSFTPPQHQCSGEKLAGGLCVVDARLATSELKLTTPAWCSNVHLKDNTHPHSDAQACTQSHDAEIHAQMVLHMLAPDSHFEEDMGLFI